MCVFVPARACACVRACVCVSFSGTILRRTETKNVNVYAHTPTTASGSLFCQRWERQHTLPQQWGWHLDRHRHYCRQVLSSSTLHYQCCSYSDTYNAGVADTGRSRGCIFADYDNDGKLDLYVANRYSANKLYPETKGNFHTKTQDPTFHGKAAHFSEEAMRRPIVH